MSNVNGTVFYCPNNTLTPNSGIQNVPVVLYSSGSGIGATVLTDANGTFLFTNVPAGTYQLVEAWGASGGAATPVDFTTSAVAMTPPVEAEPPLSALSVVPPAMADFLMAISPNLLNVTVAGGDVSGQNFYDAPVGSKPVVFNGISMVGPNLITVADNGSFGSVPSGSPVNTIPPVAPYPAVTPGLPYQAAPEITDGHYSIVNIRRKVNTSFAWWNLSDHETMLETGRFMFVNGDKPGAILFTQTTAVTPGTNYTLTGWGLNLLDIIGTPPRFAVEVLAPDGSPIGYQDFNSLQSTSIPIWYQGGFLFNSGANSSVTVNILSVAPFSLTGNDYAIDEIRLFEVNLLDLLTLDKSFSPSTIYSDTSGVGATSTVTAVVTNTSTLNAPNTVFQDTIDPRLQFVPGSVTVNGSGIGFETADPNTGFSLGSLTPGEVRIVSFQVTSLVAGPVVIPNTANASYDAATNGNGDVIRNTITSNEANFEIIINRAVVTVTKAVDKAYAKPDDVLTYTLLLNNTGNVSATNVTIVDAIPLGTTLVPGSLVGAGGNFPTLTLANPIPAGGSASVSFKVKINGIPTVNPIPNFASVAYKYTVDPTAPDGSTGTGRSNTVTTLVSIATLTAKKTVDKSVTYIGDVITYQLSVQNTGNIPANNVVLTDLLPLGVSLVPGTLVVNVPYSGTLDAALALTNPVAPLETVTLSFKVKVIAMPNPNPIINQATVNYTYTVDPRDPDGETGTVTTNPVCTLAFRYNYSQQISDLIESVALEQAALAAIANSEGAKIQKLVAMNGITTQELLCLNESVSDMMDSIAMLEAVLKQKLGLVNCQIKGCDM